jgi:hypothetical protein
MKRDFRKVSIEYVRWLDKMLSEELDEEFMKVAVEYIKWLDEERAKINRVPLEEITFFENCEVVEVDKEVLEDFKFTGLVNTDFILTDCYKDRKIKDVYSWKI